MTPPSASTTLTNMRIGSLFSGIGGLELGLEWAGHGPVVWQVEQVPPILDAHETPRQALARARRQTALHHFILQRHWPHAQRFKDVTTLDPETLDPVDLICGGFPCQNLSLVNQYPKHPYRDALWSHFLRIITALRPSWVVIENVYQAWRSWVPAVRNSLWSQQYASVCIRMCASDVGARHRRARGFVLASTDLPPAPVWRAILKDPTQFSDAHHLRPPLPNEPWPGAGLAEPEMGLSLHGLSLQLDRPNATRDRIRALGNAVVPPVAEAVGRIITIATRTP